jgi:flagellar motor component MotA
MFAIIGIVIVFGAVAADYFMEQGNTRVLLQPRNSSSSAVPPLAPS